MKFNAAIVSKKFGLFLGLGVGVVLAFFGLMLMLYVVFWGAIIGGVLFLIYLIKERFFPKKKPDIIHSPSGRIIEANETEVKDTSKKTD